MSHDLQTDAGRAEEPAGTSPGELTELVARMLDRRHGFLQAAERFGTPQYLLHAEALRRQIARFCGAFARAGQVARVHYALKANPTLPLVKLIHDAGLAADASSGMELELALRVGFTRIVCSGPAKLPEELALAAARSDRVTVHLDSFAELERLQEAAAAAGRTAQAGVRVSLDEHGLWTKFGVPLPDLPAFVARAARLDRVRLAGVQFHLSWNRSAQPYVDTLRRLGPVLRAAAPPEGWRFVDVGGGFYPEGDEAIYPWLTPRARALAVLRGERDSLPPADWDLRYLVHQVQPIESMAADLLAAFEEHITRPLGPVELWLEPGRFLANPAVHILLAVRDRKGADIAITDGGTHLLGWERLELEHVPLINLSRPGLQQCRCRVYGSLCTPHDLWGYSCYGGSPAVGDVLLLPHQGAYVQTLAQRFIKPLARTVLWAEDGQFAEVEPQEAWTARYPALASSPSA